ncbi:hypothetical protein [Streptococcus suis]|uniref:hypothetical protein n=1 Tax=Streptococcus suis TaxID=1307 RepID=UPI00209BCEF0|nr:hypothetical protein [Streptococcus suis]MCO8178091.1 hypothetical protein [Streptococcus suis]HEM3464651.1 hypothetical protein [Streptococcus suis]
MHGFITQLPDSTGKGAKVSTRNRNFGTLSIYRLPSTGIELGTTVKIRIQYGKASGVPYAVFEQIADRNNTIYNTEDRNQWYKLGEKKEILFVKSVVPNLDRELIINPDKKDDPTKIDLWDVTNNRPADLKVQTTPFFTSSKHPYKGSHYDPQYTVTFNKKDYEKYKKEYPNADIYFWVTWDQLTYKEHKVEPMSGVWRARFEKMAEYIDDKIVYLHKYHHRKDDDYNAKDSYLFSLSDQDIFEKIY